MRRLVVVWGLKTSDYGFFNRFYPARRLSDECKKRSVALRFLFPGDLSSFLALPVSETERRDSLILIRGNVREEDVLPAERALWKCVNDSQSRSIANDKLATARFLESRGWPTPATFPASVLGRPGSSVIADAEFEAGLPLAFPFVVKPRFGSRGAGVILVRTQRDLLGLAEIKEVAELSKRGTAPGHSGLGADLIAQEYIAASHGRDLRVFFAGGEVLATAIREGEPGSFLSNASAGGRFIETLELPDFWKRIVLAIARESGLWYGSVDFLFTDERDLSRPDSLTVCEINAAPGFEALERDCGLDIAGPLLDALMRDF
jgi:gamma-F420-2:alpha-L-glutamate ligase